MNRMRRVRGGHAEGSCSGPELSQPVASSAFRWDPILQSRRTYAAAAVKTGAGANLSERLRPGK